jgi:protease I
MAQSLVGARAMSGKLEGKKVAILATDGFEQSELMSPYEALREAGAEPVIVSPKDGQIQGFKHAQPGEKVEVDLTLDQADPDDFDALVLPGGVMNPDALRMIPKAVHFVKEFAMARKPIAAICHGPWMLIEADLVDGRRVTSWPSLKTDLRNAGAEWTDAEVVTDRGLVTSRNPDDLPAFNRKLIEEIAEGRHERHGPKRVGPGARAQAGWIRLH